MGLKNLRSKASEKADRKFDKKVEFYSKVRSETAASIQATKTISKSKSARRRAKKIKSYDLSSLTELLPELNLKKEEAAPTQFKLNGKSRKNLLLKEGKQLAAVLENPAFKSDPLGAIQQHLQMTQPAVEKPEKKKKKKTGANDKKKKKKSKKPKPASGDEQMEM